MRTCSMRSSTKTRVGLVGAVAANRMVHAAGSIVAEGKSSPEYTAAGACSTRQHDAVPVTGDVCKDLLLPYYGA